jgi:hypothetical protein
MAKIITSEDFLGLFYPIVSHTLSGQFRTPGLRKLDILLVELPFQNLKREIRANLSVMAGRRSALQMSEKIPQEKAVR